MNTLYAISLIDEYRLEEWYDLPRRYEQKFLLQWESYKRTAIDEIKYYLMEHEDVNPISALEEFRCQMDDNACKSGSSEANFMFSVYYDVASDILDILISEGVD